MARPPFQRGLIGAIKAGQAWLDWDDATYRSVLARLCDGKTSSTKCSLDELKRVREYMHEQGFPRQSGRHGKRPKVASSRTAVLSKIEALLADAGRKWKYAETMCEHMFKVKRLEWLETEQLSSLMQALIIDAKRRANREKNNESGTGNESASSAGHSDS